MTTRTLDVRCRSCFRVERWVGDDREVAVEGGVRRPDGPPELAAWRILVASHEGTLGPVVAACPACGLPMVADASDEPAIPWSIPLPQGELVVKRHGLRGPGALDWAQANALVERTYPRPRLLDDYLGAGALGQTALMVVMLGPLVAWLATLTLIVVFLIGLTQ